MTTDINMQHMTMKEYVAVAMLSELANAESTRKAIARRDTTSHEVVSVCFAWAEVFMEVREQRNAKTKEA